MKYNSTLIRASSRFPMHPEKITADIGESFQCSEYVVHMITMVCRIWGNVQTIYVVKGHKNNPGVLCPLESQNPSKKVEIIFLLVTHKCPSKIYDRNHEALYCFFLLITHSAASSCLIYQASFRHRINMRLLCEQVFQSPYCIAYSLIRIQGICLLQTVLINFQIIYLYSDGTCILYFFSMQYGHFG